MGSKAFSAPPPIELEAIGETTSSVLFLHGLGDSGAGFLDLAQFLQKSMPHTRFVLPHAPNMPVTLNGGMVMPAWYDLKGIWDRENEDFEGIEEARSYIHTLIDKEKEKVGSEKVVVGGFSQGGALSVYSAYQYAHKLAGVVILSAYLPCRSKWKQGIQECNRTTRAFIGHGRMDQMVPTMLASSTQERLQEERIPNEMTVYEGLEHSVSMEEVNDVLAFIRSVLEDTPAKL